MRPRWTAFAFRDHANSRPTVTRKSASVIWPRIASTRDTPGGPGAGRPRWLERALDSGQTSGDLRRVWSRVGGDHPVARAGAALLVAPLVMSLVMAGSVAGDDEGGFVAWIYLVFAALPTLVVGLLIGF